MKTLKLKNRFQTNATLIANDFIDNYMPEANGEYVKVYLFLLRHWDDPRLTLTISTIADYLDNTEKDILRAFRYWESEGLLTLEKDENGKIAGLALENVPFFSYGRSVASSPVPLNSEAPVMQEKERLSTYENGFSASSCSNPTGEESSLQKTQAIPLDSFKAQKELKNLLFIAEQYLGKTLSKTDADTISYFYNTLGMSADLVEYLIGYCVENGHKSIHYIQKVAVSWAENCITTVEQARTHSMNYNKNCYTVLNAFGIKNRGPAVSETAFIRKWTEEFGFTLDIILEACRRTISATHQPSFEYADSILEKWHRNGVRQLKDIAPLDEAFQKEKASRRPAPQRQQTAKNMNNFQRRSYDMDSLEEQLLNSN